MTALVTGCPRYSSAACFSFCRIIAEISGGVQRFACRVDLHVTVARRGTTWYGTIFISSDDFVEAAAHEALDREDRVLRVGDGLPLGDLPDQPLAGLGERDDRRRQPPAFRIGDDDGLAAFHDGDDGVGRAQVDADDFAH